MKKANKTARNTIGAALLAVLATYGGVVMIDTETGEITPVAPEWDCDSAIKEVNNALMFPGERDLTPDEESAAAFIQANCMEPEFDFTQYREALRVADTQSEKNQIINACAEEMGYRGSREYRAICREEVRK